ncbi:hypothetical protein LB579_33660, partial [Mesorhizobium sp. BR1-1-7]|uniref:hypothetical protein n=1 Tax=Mesorhizobium sp. BR1-1-7 TaxID=2876647 RepID=UPI001CCC280E
MNADGSTTTPPDILLRLRQYIPEFTRPDGSRNIRGLATAFALSRATITRYLAKIDIEDAQAAHSCGKGHLGCAAKRHLSWKT